MTQLKTLTPNELLRQIRHWLIMPSGDGIERTAWPELVAQIDATLLDSDSQAAGESKSVMRRLEQQGAICRECRIERGYRPILDYVQLCPRHASMDDAATCMRDKCVDAIKSLRAIPHGAAYNNAVNDAIRKCESLTLDELELEKQK